MSSDSPRCVQRALDLELDLIAEGRQDIGERKLIKILSSSIFPFLELQPALKAAMAVPRPPKSRKARQDDSVMATNKSSIVSKRSVERIYYQEPHFYRYFVKKPLRRSPLINRE